MRFSSWVPFLFSLHKNKIKNKHEFAAKDWEDAAFERVRIAPLVQVNNKIEDWKQHQRQY